MSAGYGDAGERTGRRGGDEARRRGVWSVMGRWLAPAVLCGGIMGSFAAASFASDGVFVLRADGDPDTSFRGECRLETAQGEQVVVIEGGVPQTREMRARGVSCRFTNLTAQSLLTIEIARDGSHGSTVSRSSSRGRGTIAVSLR